MDLKSVHTPCKGFVTRTKRDRNKLPKTYSTDVMTKQTDKI